jgi:hypothetical protein
MNVKFLVLAYSQDVNGVKENTIVYCTENFTDAMRFYEQHRVKLVVVPTVIDYKVGDLFADFKNKDCYATPNVNSAKPVIDFDNFVVDENPKYFINSNGSIELENGLYTRYLKLKEVKCVERGNGDKITTYLFDHFYWFQKKLVSYNEEIKIVNLASLVLVSSNLVKS